MANAKDLATRALTGFHEAVFGISNGRVADRGYGQYQQRTDRDIPLVILEP